MGLLLKRICNTRNEFAPLIMRLALGVVILAHGLQKTVGAFGGYGFSGTMDFFTGPLELPWILALGVILVESLGALMVILGALTRLAAAAVGTVLGVAIFKGGHLDHGFFMNWSGNQQGEGFEFHILVVGLAVALVATGGGRLSIDRRIITPK